MYKKLKTTIDDFDSENPKKCKKNLKKVLVRQEESTKVLSSSVKIMNFIICDMLDYAQLGAGQFRKFIQKMNLVES